MGNPNDRQTKGHRDAVALVLLLRKMVELRGIEPRTFACHASALPAEL